jgi:hypothetical protein
MAESAGHEEGIERTIEVGLGRRIVVKVFIGPIGWVDEAMAFIKDGHQSFDGAVLDVNLHGKKSYPIADELAARDIPFIFSTGYGSGAIDETHQHCPRCEKPFSRAALTAAFAAARK